MRIASRGSRRIRSHIAFVLLVLALGLLTSGCLRANVSMSVEEDDTVSGQLLLATFTADGKPPFELHPPRELADRVQVKPFRSGEETGAELTFTKLEFDELRQLAEVLSGSDSRYQFKLHRSGSLVMLDGSVDLTPLADTESTVSIDLNAPGNITTTNGEESAGSVSWHPQPGEVTQISATYQFAGAGDWSWVWWTLLVLGGTFLIAGLVGVLALSAHMRSSPVPQRS